MDYLISFLEGVVTFISPCLLPMIPIYIAYFARQDEGGGKSHAVVNALGFIAGFTLVFVTLGAFAGLVGGLLIKYSIVINIVCGIIVVILGLSFMDILNIPFLKRSRVIDYHGRRGGFFTSLVFGMVFSIGWTPCVGVFLGSALMLAASQGESLRGVLMLLAYSLGLGIPFILSAVLIDKLKSSFEFIKRNHRAINIVSGAILVIVGILMATGLMGRLLNLLRF